MSIGERVRVGVLKKLSGDWDAMYDLCPSGEEHIFSWGRMTDPDPMASGEIVRTELAIIEVLKRHGLRGTVRVYGRENRITFDVIASESNAVDKSDRGWWPSSHSHLNSRRMLDWIRKDVGIVASQIESDDSLTFYRDGKWFSVDVDQTVTIMSTSPNGDEEIIGRANSLLELRDILINQT